MPKFTDDEILHTLAYFKERTGEFPTSTNGSSWTDLTRQRLERLGLSLPAVNTIKRRFGSYQAAQLEAVEYSAVHWPTMKAPHPTNPEISPEETPVQQELPLTIPCEVLPPEATHDPKLTATLSKTDEVQRLAAEVAEDNERLEGELKDLREQLERERNDRNEEIKERTRLREEIQTLKNDCTVKDAEISTLKFKLDNVEIALAEATEARDKAYAKSRNLQEDLKQAHLKMAELQGKLGAPAVAFGKPAPDAKSEALQKELYDALAQVDALTRELAEPDFQLPLVRRAVQAVLSNVDLLDKYAPKDPEVRYLIGLINTMKEV